MVPFQINLAQGAVIPLAVRKRWYRWLLLYFLVGAGTVGGTAYRVVADLVALRYRSDWVARQESHYAKSRGVTELAAHGRVLAGRLQLALKELETLQACQACSEKSASSLLAGLMLALPRGAELAAVEVDVEARRMRFDIAMPADRDLPANNTPSHWIAAWEQEPLMAGRLKHISADNSERSRIGVTPVMLWRFSAEMD